MPCYEPGYKYSKGDAILCSVFRRAEEQGKMTELLDSLDYDLIGFPRSTVVEWWIDHQQLDAEKLKERS